MQQLLSTGQTFSTELSKMPCQVGPFLGGEARARCTGPPWAARRWP